MTNLAVAGMAMAHRERLGKELIGICQWLKHYRMGGDLSSNVAVDENGVGVRVEGLLDAGADVSWRGDGANTPLHLVSSVIYTMYCLLLLFPIPMSYSLNIVFIWICNIICSLPKSISM